MLVVAWSLVLISIAGAVRSEFLNGKGKVCFEETLQYA